MRRLVLMALCDTLRCHNLTEMPPPVVLFRSYHSLQKIYTVAMSTDTVEYDVTWHFCLRLATKDELNLLSAKSITSKGPARIPNLDLSRN